MSKFNLRGKLTLTVHSARQLTNKELMGKMDPFCVVTISGSKDEKFKTKIAKDMHQTPVWEQSYIFNLEGKEEILHVNVWNQATLGDDHIGRCDLALDGCDMSGKPAWYQLKDKQNFTKQTGEVRMTCVFDGTGLPPGSLAFTSNQKRLNPASPTNAAAAGAAVASPATPQIAAQAVASPQAQVYGSVAPAPAPQAQVYGSAQPNYQQPPPQQQYQSQAPPPQQQPVYASQQPVYAPPSQPMYQQPPAPQYQQPPQQFVQQQPVYQSQAPPVYQQAPQPVYQSQPAVVFQQPGVSFQPAAPVFVQQQPQVVYQQVGGGYPGQQRPGGQLIGYWPNGQPRYA